VKFPASFAQEASVEILKEDGALQEVPLFKVHGTGFISKADGTQVPITLDGTATAEQLKAAGLPVPEQGEADERS
jgi:hypothetical protein